MTNSKQHNANKEASFSIDYFPPEVIVVADILLLGAILFIGMKW